MEEYDLNLYSPEDELLLPRLPRSLPFDELVFIIEDRITALIELPYSFEQVHGAPFYVSTIRPIVASLILPYDDDADIPQVAHPPPVNQPSSAANLRANSSKTNIAPAPTKTYSFRDQHRGIVAALLVARLEFLDSASEGFSLGPHPKYDDSEDMMFKERGVLEARAYTAELVAIKFLSCMTLELDRIEFLTYEYNADNENGVDDSGDNTMRGQLTQETSSVKPQINQISKSMVHLPLTMKSSSPYAGDRSMPLRRNSNTALYKSTGNLPNLSSFSKSYSFDDRNRGFLHKFNSPADNKSRPSPKSASEQTPLLLASQQGEIPHFTSEPQLPAAANLYNSNSSDVTSINANNNHSDSNTNFPINTNKNQTRDATTKKKEEWGYSAHDRLVDHGLFIEQYSDQSALDLALAGSQPARKFISSDAVQSVADGIWTGHIMYWKTIEMDAKKNIHLYNPLDLVDWYSRLRVPRYRAFFMMINYSILLTFFYLLLFRRHQNGEAVSIEVFLNIWFVGFVLDEVSQAREAGSFAQYFADFWSFFDLCIVGFFMMFAGLRVLGIVLHKESYTDLSYDILSLEAVLLVPRLFSFLSIFPYFGTLLPCLRDLTVEFFKFLVIIMIIYVGFFTTFSFLGRDNFSFHDMSWLLVHVFFGSSYSGFDAAPQISPIFGPPLMLIFVTLTNILLVTVLISILSERFSGIMHNAKQEYAIHFLSTVVESVNTSDRVTYFYPPLNILGVLIRPFRVFYDHTRYRGLRIKVLKATHWPFVALVWVYEYATLGVRRRRIKKYLKIRHDRRISVVKRMALQSSGISGTTSTETGTSRLSGIFGQRGFNNSLFNPSSNPFLSNGEDDNENGASTHSSDDDHGGPGNQDLERGDGGYFFGRHNKATPSQRPFPNTGSNDNVSKRRIRKRSETFFPKFKRFPKNIKRVQS
jgi:hypothetical protein